MDGCFRTPRGVFFHEHHRNISRFAPAHAAHFKSEDHVVEDATPRKQQVLLQHVADVTMRVLDQDASNLYLAILDRNKSRNRVKKRGLAAAGGADERQNFALTQFCVDMFDRFDRVLLAFVIDNAHTFCAQDDLGHAVSLSGTPGRGG